LSSQLLKQLTVGEGTTLSGGKFHIFIIQLVKKWRARSRDSSWIIKFHIVDSGITQYKAIERYERYTQK